MNPCADCGTLIPKLTLCWLVHERPAPGQKMGLTKTVCVDCHDKETDALEH